jgi:hypothetical protein
MKITKTSIILTVTLLVVIVLFFSNPKADQFQQYLKETIKNEGNEMGGVSGAIEGALSGTAATLIDFGTKRTDFYLFSIYENKVLNTTHLGILNNFFEISN